MESNVYSFHGTFDALGHFNNPKELFVLDWKTSSRVDKFYGCQLAAYAHAYTEQTGISIVGGGIVRLEKDPSKRKQIEIKQFDHLEDYFDVFLALKKVYDFEHEKAVRV